MRIFRAEISSSVTGLHEFVGPSVEWGFLDSRFSEDAASVMFLKKSLNQSKANHVLSNGMGSRICFDGAIFDDSKGIESIDEALADVTFGAAKWSPSGDTVDAECCSTGEADEI